MTADKLELIRQQSMEQYGFGPNAMKKVKVCTQCGNPSPSDERFCKECGYRLPEKTLYDIYKERHVCCPTCDTVLSDGMSFCPQCGTKIETDKKNNE